MTEDERYESLRHCKYDFSLISPDKILVFTLKVPNSDVCSVSLDGFAFFFFF